MPIKQNMKITRVTAEDLPKYYEHFVKVIQSNGQEARPIFSPRESVDSYDDYSSKILKEIDGEKPTLYIWAITDEERNFYGHVDLKVIRAAHSQHRCTLGIGIEKELRSQSWGTKMMEFAIQEAKTLGFEYIDIGVFEGNERAYQFYIKLGFIEIGRRPDCFRAFGKSLTDISLYLDLKKI